MPERCSDVRGSRPGRRDRFPGPGLLGKRAVRSGRRGFSTARAAGLLVSATRVRRPTPQRRASRVVRPAFEFGSELRFPKASPGAELANHCMQQTNGPGDRSTLRDLIGRLQLMRQHSTPHGGFVSVRMLGWLIAVTVERPRRRTAPNLPGWPRHRLRRCRRSPSHATAIPANSATRKPQIGPANVYDAGAPRSLGARAAARRGRYHRARCARSVDVVSTTDTERMGGRRVGRRAGLCPRRTGGTRWPSGRSRRFPSRSTEGWPGLGVRGV